MVSYNFWWSCTTRWYTTRKIEKNQKPVGPRTGWNLTEEVRWDIIINWLKSSDSMIKSSLYNSNPTTYRRRARTWLQLRFACRPTGTRWGRSVNEVNRERSVNEVERGGRRVANELEWRWTYYGWAWTVWKRCLDEQFHLMWNDFECRPTVHGIRTKRTYWELCTNELASY